MGPWRVRECTGSRYGTSWRGSSHGCWPTPQHVKNVPAARWTQRQRVAGRMAPARMLAGSFVPPRWIRDLRDLTRTRAALAQESSRMASGIQKVLEDANIQLASVASDTLGKSGQAMLAALIAGQSDLVPLADLAVGTWRGKLPQLRRALEGWLREHHRFLLKRLLAVALCGKRDRVD